MAVLLENVTNYIWQAFNVLQVPLGSTGSSPIKSTQGQVHKSKLKVLTANIGTILDLYGVEKGLEHYQGSSTLNFDQFKYYLQKEVFTLPDKLSLFELRNYETKVAEICWLLCRKKYLERDHKVFSDLSMFQIFRIFCVLAELVPDNDKTNYQVVLHPSEATTIAQKLASSLGNTLDDEDFINLSVTLGTYHLATFVAVLESRCLNKVTDNLAISEAIKEIYQNLVEDVIKKGYLSKRGYIFPAMREYWFVLRPSELTYYKSRSEKDRAGMINLEPGSRVEPKSGYKINLHTSERNFELGTSDNMSRLQWMSSLQLAVEHSGGCQSYQRLQVARRRSQRQGRIQDMLRAKDQLQKERTARQAAEGQAKELEAVVKEESKRLNELEQIRDKLERLLEEETQAKKDEEIVRALQARVLNEEWEKREELERLQIEQRLLLEEERGKRKEYEDLQRQKEQQLLDAQERLQQLENERKVLDDQLTIAHDKIKYSEDRKEALEAKLMIMTPLVKEGDRIRRSQSFMPSTKERPVFIEVRAATLRKTSKQ